MPIVDEIERRTGRSMLRAAVYVTLRWLEEKGLISSWMSDPTPERGGKSRRCVKVERLGTQALREARKAAVMVLTGLLACAVPLARALRIMLLNRGAMCVLPFGLRALADWRGTLYT